MKMLGTWVVLEKYIDTPVLSLSSMIGLLESFRTFAVRGCKTAVAHLDQREVLVEQIFQLLKAFCVVHEGEILSTRK